MLSFASTDESHGIQFEGVLRQPEWQAKTQRSSSKSIIKGALAMQKLAEREERTKKNLESSNNSKKLSSKKLGLPTNSEFYHRNIIKYLIVDTRLLNAHSYFAYIHAEVRKARNNNRKLKKSYSHMMKTNNKSRKNSHMSIGSDFGHEMDIGSPNGSLSRSINPSPTPGGHHRYER